jgi:HPt (histidine-containing phosphotransfer) domain-containing protein
VQSFSETAMRDVAAIGAARDAARLAARAHRLKGAAQMAGARLIAEQAARVEAAARTGDLAAARQASAGMEKLLAETLRVMRSAV